MGTVYKLLRICCSDPRQDKCGVPGPHGWKPQLCPHLCGEPSTQVYLIGTAGACVFHELVENFLPLLGIVHEMQLVSHADCAFSRVQLKIPLEEAISPADVERAEALTAIRRDQAIGLLLNHHGIQASLGRGLKFSVGHRDVIVEKRTLWLHEWDPATGRMVPISSTDERNVIVAQRPTVNGQRIDVQ